MLKLYLKKLYTSIVIESHIYALNVAFGLKYPRLSRDTVRYIQGGLVVAGTGLHRWPSNGIFYVVNLKEAHFYQKCHDTECYGFRSAAQQLPEPVLGQLRTQLAAGSAGERQAVGEFLLASTGLSWSKTGHSWPQLASTGVCWECLEKSLYLVEMVCNG